jgi:hypothetical protein
VWRVRCHSHATERVHSCAMLHTTTAINIDSDTGISDGVVGIDCDPQPHSHTLGFTLELAVGFLTSMFLDTLLHASMRAVIHTQPDSYKQLPVSLEHSQRLCSAWGCSVWMQASETL